MDNVIFFYREPFFTYWGFAGLGLAAAFVCCALLCLRFRLGLRGWLRLLAAALLSLAAGGAAAKLFGMAARAIYLKSVGEAFGLAELIRNGSYVFYGGLLGWFASLALLLPRLLPQWRRLCWDMMTVCTALFHGFARLGCYCATEVKDGYVYWRPCCYGRKMDNAFCAHFWDGRLPTQLIESAFEFLLFALLLALLLRGAKKSRGRLSVLYLVAYGVFRYLIEFFRDDAVRGAIGPFSFSQLISLLILVGVLGVSLLRQKGLVRTPPPDADGAAEP